MNSNQKLVATSSGTLFKFFKKVKEEREECCSVSSDTSGAPVVVHPNPIPDEPGPEVLAVPPSGLADPRPDEATIHPNDSGLFVGRSENLTLEELKEKFLLLLDIVKCAVCLESVQQDMVQCVNGHLLCSDCKDGLKICPTCRENFSCTKPSHFVSQVIDILPTRCKYTNCPTIVRNDDDHERYCGFKPTNCKWCSWNGPGKDIWHHCNEEHDCETFRDDRSWPEFKIDEEFSRFIACSFTNNLFFWEETLNDPYTKTFTKIWHMVPNGKPTDDWFVTLSFKSESGPFTATKIKLNLDPDGPSEDNSISVPLSLLSYFIDERNCLTYSVERSVE